jgi:hypothetical protein
MRPLIRSRVANAATAATVAGVAGLFGAVSIVLWLAVGQPWATVNDLVLAVVGFATAPMMVGSYELGGVVPLWPARLSLGSGILACLVYAGIHLAFGLGLVHVGDTVPPAAIIVALGVSFVVIGLWLIGAPLLAGPWLPGPLRWLGALGGLGFVLTGAGLIVGPMLNPLTALGGAGFELVFPIWALLMARVFRRQAGP